MSRAAVAGVVLFWLASSAAALLAPGYSVVDDYLSSLAGRGSQVAPLGVAALAVLGAAHLAAAVTRRSERPVAVALALAGTAGLAVAAFRTGCPLGAAGCGSAPNDAPADLADRVHAGAVLAYEVAIVAAMLLHAAYRLHDDKGSALVAALCAVASVVLLAQTAGAATGLWQRAWVAVNTGWLVLATLRSRRRHPPTTAPRARSA